VVFSVLFRAIQYVPQWPYRIEDWSKKI